MTNRERGAELMALEDSLRALREFDLSDLNMDNIGSLPVLVEQLSARFPLVPVPVPKRKPTVMLLPFFLVLFLARAFFCRG